MSEVTISVPVTAFSDNEVACIIADKLWTEDHIENLATELMDETFNEGNEDNLLALAKIIVGRLSDLT
ncbi:MULTISPECIES: hypothetical protein [Pseudomonadota]|uniref:hypothetical protein n=1 Tax=Pseudomonadota TaxID=1224 RepID=UPI0026159D83|nr:MULTISPECIES: hypothetical protein [Pseudomonadota]